MTKNKTAIQIGKLLDEFEANYLHDDDDDDDDDGDDAIIARVVPVFSSCSFIIYVVLLLLLLLAITNDYHTDVYFFMSKINQLTVNTKDMIIFIAHKRGKMRYRYLLAAHPHAMVVPVSETRLTHCAI